MNATARVSAIGVSITDRERVRLVRIERNLASGFVALFVTAMMLDHSASPAGFLALVIAVGVTVRCFARAVDAGFGKFYGWVFGEPTAATILDRVAFRVIHRRRYGQHRPSDPLESDFDGPSGRQMPLDEPRVRIVDIEKVELRRSGNLAG